MKAAITGAFRGAWAPLVSYYAVTVAVPVLNGATLDRPFLEHVAFVLAVPPLLVLLTGVGRGLVSPSSPAAIPEGPAPMTQQRGTPEGLSRRG